MTKNHTSSALHQRGKEIGLKVTQTSLKSEKNSVEEMILQDAEVFWKDYYVHKTQNILENKKEKNYILSQEQEKGVHFLKQHEHNNCAIIAPTGFGKTLIVFEEINRLLTTKNRIFFTAPTNNLLGQQCEAFGEFCTQKKVNMNIQRLESGSESLENAKVIFLTPHLLSSLAKDNKIENNDVIVCDEIHTGEGKEGKNLEDMKYPSFEVMNILKQNQKTPRVIGLTATTNKNMLQKVFLQGHICRLGSKEDFNDKKFHFLRESGNILEQSGMNQANILLHERKKKLAQGFYNSIYESLYFRANSHLKEYWSIDNVMKTNYITDERKREILKFIDNSIVEFKRKVFLKNTFYQIERINIYKKSCDENNYRIFIDKLSQDYEAIKDKTSEEAGFILGFGKMLKQMIVEEKKVHPKEMKLDEILAKNKGKTTLVYVEHEGLIHYFMKKYSKIYRCSFLKSAKNNKERIINDYTHEAINQKKLDVVFTTSVTKLGMNLDVNELFLYHLPKNYKDLLQFSGRIGRFEIKNGYRENNIYCLYPEGTMERGMSFKVYREAKDYIDEFFGDETALRTPEKVIKQTQASVQAELFSTLEAPFMLRPGTKRKRWDKRGLGK